MIVVDTSALMAIVLREPDAARCVDVLQKQDEALISAGTLTEALIVAGRRGVSGQVNALIDGLALTVVPVTEGTARRVAEAYGQWGKGVHPAGLNLGDCFAYALAREHGCPLLFVGGDFTKTDVTPAL